MLSTIESLNGNMEAEQVLTTSQACGRPRSGTKKIILSHR